MDKINVSLYGGKRLFGKGRETPLKAKEIYCDKYNECSLYKSGCCLNVGTAGQRVCNKGDLNIITGYTSRSIKYSKFKSKYTSDEKYGKLKSPSNCLIALIGNEIYLNLSYSQVDLDEDGEYFVNKTVLSNGSCWVEKDRFTVDLLNSLCNYKPYAMMGGEITSYRKEIIPSMLLQLQRILPELYKKFISVYPEFYVAPNYVGKYAYILTMKKGSELIDTRGNRFIFDGEYLVCEDWSSAFLPFGAKGSYVRIKVTEDMEYKISDNSMVEETTVFVP
ncbi:hypothetical protein ACEE21_15070 [Clostridium baratii]